MTLRETERRVIRHTIVLDQLAGLVQRSRFDLTVRRGWSEEARWALVGLSSLGTATACAFTVNFGGVASDPYVLQISNGTGAANPMLLNLERVLFPCPERWDGRGDIIPGVDLPYDTLAFGGTDIASIHLGWGSTGAFYFTLQFMRLEDS